MRKTCSAALFIAALVLTGCTGSGTAAHPMNNPLYADWYYKDMVEGMMALEIRNDPILKNARMKEKVDSLRKDSLAKSQEITDLIRTGKQGPLMFVSEEVQGRVLMLNSVLYFSPETNIRPGHDLRVYLTSLGDPLQVTGSGSTGFPDASAIDLGVMRTPYGSSQFDVPPPPEGSSYRAVVLWDRTLKRMHAFAQLQ
jgi:hypothetical protein